MTPSPWHKERLHGKEYWVNDKGSKDWVWLQEATEPRRNAQIWMLTNEEWDRFLAPQPMPELRTQPDLFA